MTKIKDAIREAYSHPFRAMKARYDKNTANGTNPAYMTNGLTGLVAGVYLPMIAGAKTASAVFYPVRAITPGGKLVHRVLKLAGGAYAFGATAGYTVPTGLVLGVLAYPISKGLNKAKTALQI